MNTNQPHSGGPEDLAQKLGELLPGFEARETEARMRGFEEGRKFSASARENEIELAKFFDRHEKQLDQTRIYPVGCSCGFYAPRGDHSAHLAKELVAYLRGGSK